MCSCKLRDAVGSLESCVSGRSGRYADPSPVVARARGGMWNDVANGTRDRRAGVGGRRTGLFFVRRATQRAGAAANYRRIVVGNLAGVVCNDERGRSYVHAERRKRRLHIVPQYAEIAAGGRPAVEHDALMLADDHIV